MARDPIAQTRSAAYRFARILGDVQAARRGPTAVAKRQVRRRVLRKSAGWINRWTA